MKCLSNLSARPASHTLNVVNWEPSLEWCQPALKGSSHPNLICKNKKRALQYRYHHHNCVFLQCSVAKLKFLSNCGKFCLPVSLQSIMLCFSSLHFNRKFAADQEHDPIIPVLLSSWIWHRTHRQSSSKRSNQRTHGKFTLKN